MTDSQTQSGQPHTISDEEMEQLLQKYLPADPLKPGSIIQATVIEVNERRALLDLGQKSEGMVPAKEMRNFTAEKPLNEGDVVNAYIVKSEAPASGIPLLSIDRAQGEEGWRILEESMNANTTMTGKVIDINRGGLVILSEGAQGFAPLSHLASPIREMFGKDPIDMPEVKRQLMDTSIEFKVLDFNKRRNRAIFSHRLAIQEQKEQRKLKLIQELQENQVITGTVTGISDFGAFIDIGGADGLVHISEISWEPIKSPADVLTVGQEVEVAILKIDQDNLKIALSLKRLTPEPWQDIHERFQEGQTVEATITNVVHFGAFAKLAPGIEGLIHLSEFSHDKIEHPQEVVSVGDRIVAIIMRIEEERKRLALSMKRLQPRSNGGGNGARQARSRVEEEEQEQPEEQQPEAQAEEQPEAEAQPEEQQPEAEAEEQPEAETETEAQPEEEQPEAEAEEQPEAEEEAEEEPKQ